jgi:hypothetical protein
VIFRREAVDVITNLTELVPTDLMLTKQFGALVAKLRRCPSVSELQALPRVSVQQYIARYGSWQNALDRLRQLFPDLDFGRLAMPSVLEGLELSEYADVIDSNQSYVRSLGLILKARLLAASEAFLAVGSAPRFRKKVVPACQGWIRELVSAEQYLREMGLILGLHLSGERCVLRPAERADPEVIATYAGRLKQIHDCTECYTLVGSFLEHASLMSELLSSLSEFDRDEHDGDFLARMRDLAGTLERVFISSIDGLQRILERGDAH